MFAAFLPAISGNALKDKGRIIRRWRINLRTTSDLAELAEWMNPVIRGWMNYYGKFYRTEMFALLRRINTYLVRWARRKFKRLRSFKSAKRWWNGLLKREPGLFAHGAWMTSSDGLDETSGVTGDCHVPFRGSPGLSPEFRRTEGSSG